MRLVLDRYISYVDIGHLGIEFTLFAHLHYADDKTFYSWVDVSWM